MFYTVSGDSPDTIVVLHGGPALGLAYLAPDLVPLSSAFTIISYDQRGSGRSTIPADSSALAMDHHLEDLEAIRRHFGLDRLTLLGHSWGGMVAVRYAAAYPDRTSRLLLMDPMPPSRALRTAAGPRARALLEERLTVSQRLRLDSLSRHSHRSQSPRAHCQRTHEIMTRVYFRDSTSAARARGNFCAGPEAALRARPRVAAAIMGALGDWDVRPMLSAVRIPVLVVHGADGAIPPEAMYEWARALPNARLLTVSRAGHYLHVDRPDVFFPAAGEFLRGVWPAEAIVVREPPPRP